MQEDRRTVRSTLNAISGGLSFRRGSIALEGVAVDYQHQGKCLLLRWKAVSTVRRVPQKALIDELLKYLHTFLATDLEQACGLIDRWRKPTHFHELASNAIGDVPAHRLTRFRRHWESPELEIG